MCAAVTLDLIGPAADEVGTDTDSTKYAKSVEWGCTVDHRVSCGLVLHGVTGSTRDAFADAVSLRVI